MLCLFFEHRKEGAGSLPNGIEHHVGGNQTATRRVPVKGLVPSQYSSTAEGQKKASPLPRGQVGHVALPLDLEAMRLCALRGGKKEPIEPRWPRRPHPHDRDALRPDDHAQALQYYKIPPSWQERTSDASGGSIKCSMQFHAYHAPILQGGWGFLVPKAISSTTTFGQNKNL